MTLFDSLREFWDFESPTMTAGTFFISIFAAAILGASITFLVMMK